MSNFNAIIAAQVRLEEEFHRSWKNFKKTPKNRLTVGYLKARRSAIDELWREISQNYRQLQASNTEKDQNHPYLTSESMEKLEGDHFEFFGNVLDKLEELENLGAPQQRGQIKAAESSHGASVEMKLPSIAIPTFSGKYAEWTLFRDLFTALIAQNASLSLVQKMYYLKTNVSDEAEQLLRHFPITADSFNSAWEALQKRYHNKRALVTAHLQKIYSGPHTIPDSAQGLRMLLSLLNENLAGLQNLGINVQSWDPILIFHMVQRLSKETHELWEQTLSASSDLATLEAFTTFLEGRFRTLEALDSLNSRSHAHNVRNNNPQRNAHVFHAASAQPTCVKCKGSHSIRQCPVFREFDAKTRYSFVKEKRLCFNCLSESHGTRKCQSTQTCLLCNKKHHTLLHFDSSHQSGPSHSECPTTPFTTYHAAMNPQMATSSAHARDSNSTNFKPLASVDETAASLQHMRAFHIQQRPQTLLATVVFNAVSSCNVEYKMRALIDPGSQASFITESAAQMLQLARTKTDVKISGLGRAHSGHSHSKVHLIIKSQWEDFSLRVEALVLSTLTHWLPARQLTSGLFDEFQSLGLADPSFNQPGPVDMVLGADIYPKLIRPGIRRTTHHDIIAQETTLGWILSGPCPIMETAANISVFHAHTSTETNPIDQQLRKFWELEEVLPVSHVSQDELECENLYSSTTTRTADGRYQVRLPFRTRPPSLGNSRNVAIARLRSLEKKFVHNAIYRSEFAAVMNEYLALGHMVPIPPQEINTSAHYYVPHHAIIKEESATTKLRVVFNASSKTTNGNSLNDTLHIGPALHVNLFDLVLCWRRYKVAFVGDIEKMYRMISLHPEDSNFQRIIWRNTPHEEVQDYKIPVVLFGLNSAPYLAMRTLKQLAKDEAHNFPRAAARLQTDIYVDDLLTGSHSIQEAIVDRTEMGNLLNAGGFKMHKWASNYNEVLEGIPKDDLATQINISLNGEDRIKTLGVLWHFQDDTLRFKWMQKNIIDLKSSSKRKVLSTISKLFDPLGWIATITIWGKILMQRLWLENLSWDDPLPSHRHTEWTQHGTDLSTIHRLHIPRWIHMAPNIKEVQLHGFCDASEQAYAATVYIRILDATDVLHIHLLTAKTRVAPVKTVSLPRLELCGAVLLSRLIKRVQKIMQISTVYAWTDSMIALACIKARSNEWKTFVANRVSEIHDLVGPHIWNHVCSNENPADLASRGGTVYQILTSALWWSGPPWLQLSKSEWPHSQIDPHLGISERRKLKVVCLYAHPLEPIPTSEMLMDLLSRYSSARTLFHVLAYVRRFVQNCRKDVCKHKSIALGNEEVSEARNLLLQVEQRIYHDEEINALRTLGHLKSSSLKALNPFLDGYGVLRVGGRLHFANLPYEERHPIILSHKSKLTQHIVLQAHRDTMHGTITLMMGYLRQQFWIIRARDLIKSCIFQCVKCFRLRHQTQQQLMGSLPSHRIEVTRPFTNVGVDYAGPIAIRTSEGRGHKSYKGYIAIFVCLSTKAIHIEVASDQTSEAFLAAFRRFIARRGLCRRIYSDCGTNFVGANSQLIQDKLRFERQIHRDLAPTLMNLDGIEWHFIPPASPHFGGSWEAGVKSLKHHLRRVIGNMTLTFEEMTTITAQVEACLNSRPLYPLTENPEDFNVLTPGHFLIGSSLLAPPAPDISSDNVLGLRRWRLCQKLTQDLWRKWSGEYLHRLQQRPKWTQTKENLKVNDLVIIHDERLPPLQWSLGRVETLHPGKDGIIRVVTLKTAKGPIVRPIVKLAKLPASYTQ